MKDEIKKPGEAASVPQGTGDRRSVLQTALTTLERLQKRLDDVESARHEPIAIVGMGCRLPGGVVDADSYWRVLAEGRDVVGQVPPDRWDVDAYYDPDPTRLGKARTKAGGFLDQIDQFEPGFFGMSPREATGVDPQHRLLLEVSWEALENAAVPVDQLDGSRTGVFVGITSTDYAERIDVTDPARSDIYLATGTALNVAAGRVSFTFGFRGPCMAIDTACSSSLVAIHAACQSLRNGESDLALAGGANVMLSPVPFVLISKWGMLSPEGRCKTFDAGADGFVRGEGCGLIVLERLSDARRNGRRILAVIRGSAINQDGRSSGLTVPNGLAQQEVVRAALSAARLKPADVGYVEAHGTGTSLGDPIEVEALAAAYGQDRTEGFPLEVGSVKSNIGHLEAASGVASVIKLVLALQHRQVPASLHVRELTPSVPWAILPLRVSTHLHDWTVPEGQPRRAGVSAFGFSGMNAHAILEEAPPVEPVEPPAPRSLYALPISARSEAALSELAARYADHLVSHSDDSLADVCATAAAGRSHLPVRLVALAADRTAMVEELRRASAGEGPAIRGTVAGGARHRTAFLFTGQGAQYAGMGHDLDGVDPVFTATLDRCAAVLDPILGRSLREVLFGAGDSGLNQTGFTQPALYALEVSLAATWRSWGIEPDVVVGHSVGEFAAAATAGIFSIEDGARLISARGRLMQALPAGGAMVSVQGDVDMVLRAVAAHPDTVSVAALNAPGTVVISGATADVEAIARDLAAAGMLTQALTVSHAFHSPLMAPMIEEFRRLAAEVIHAAPTVTWISSLTGEPLDWSTWQSRMADYWGRHAREAVAFERAAKAIAQFRCDVYLEVGPHPVLIGLAKQCLGDGAASINWVPSLRRTRPGWAQMLESVGQLYVRGTRLNWGAISGAGAQASLALPTYPFQRQHFLVPFLSKSRKVAGPSVHDLLGERLNVAGVTAQFERVLDATNPAWLADHRIASEVVMPLTAYLEASLAAARQIDPDLTVLEHVEVGAPMPVTDGESCVMQVAVEATTAADDLRIRVFSRGAADDGGGWTRHASCTAGRRAPEGDGVQSPLNDVADRLTREVDVHAFYEKLSGLGVDFGPGFRGMRRAFVGDGEALGEIDSSVAAVPGDRSYLIHPAVLDACFHVSAVAMDSLPGADDGRMYLPIGVERYEWRRTPAGPLRSHAKIRPPAVRGDMLVIDVRIETSDGEPVARIEGLRCRRADRHMFRRRAEARVETWLYETTWNDDPLPLVATTDASGVWLVFDEGAGRGAAMADLLRTRGGTVIRVVAPGDESGDAVEAVNPDRAEEFVQVIAAAREAGPLKGVVSFWPLRVPVLGVDDVPSAVQRFGTQAALFLVQALAGLPTEQPRLWIVTCGSQYVDRTETLRLEQTPAAGVARVAAVEQPDLRVTLVDLDPQETVRDVKLLVSEVLADAEVAPVAFRKGVRYSPRLARRRRRDVRLLDQNPIRLHITERGTLENLSLGPTERRQPAAGEIELRVRASGLNFRDVLSALGMYPGEIRHLGSDCAGEITAVGSAVTGFSVGDRVVAMVEGAFASHATTRWEFVAPLPPGVTFEQGAAIPTAYLTADITLNQIAKMERGDRVLIHSGAGGVGMAAIALARRVGAEIFATAGSPEKRDVLRRLGVQHALDSRSTSFADDVLRITGGAGVNIVLNSLAGAMLDRSFDCLADGGVFLEIGKRGLWTHERVEALNRGIRYYIVDCNDNARDTPEIVGQIFTRVLREIESGDLPWLPCTTFAFDRAPDAFRYMAQARHIGRVVFRHEIDPMPIDPVVRPDATYLVTGGLRGLGLLAAQWLADEGARHLVLAGRSAPDTTAEAAFAAMRARGVRVVVVSADVATAPGIDRLMSALANEMPPLGGVIHAAGVLDDGVLVRQTPERFAAVMGPKADGAWRLHGALEAHGHHPDFFACYSSMSAVLGAPGQGNYVAANAFLDALAHYRRAADRPGTSVNWGAWSEVGMAARGGVAARAGSQGFLALSPGDGMQALGVVLRDNMTQVAVVPIDWGIVAQQVGAEAPPLVRDLVRESRRSEPGSRGESERQVDLEHLPPQEREAHLVGVVRRQLATVLGLPGSPDALDPDEPFTALGLDSLTAVELRNRMQSIVGRPVPATAAFQWPTIHAMAEGVGGLFGGPAPEADPDSNREELSL